MPLCGFNKKMIDGITTFSEGLFEATMDRGREGRVDSFAAIKTEVDEIELFVRALRQKYGELEVASSIKAEMIYGIALFAHGLFKSTLVQNGAGDSDLRQNFDAEVQEIGKFLERLEHEHQSLKKSNTPVQTMRKAVDWINNNDPRANGHR